MQIYVTYITTILSDSYFDNDINLAVRMFASKYIHVFNKLMIVLLEYLIGVCFI